MAATTLEAIQDFFGLFSVYMVLLSYEVLPILQSRKI